jgi:hypothetical protein
MAAAKAAYVCLILSVGLSIAKACVLLECLTPTADPPKYHFGGKVTSYEVLMSTFEAV